MEIGPKGPKGLRNCWACSGDVKREHPFSSAGGPVAVLGPVVQPLVAPVLDAREHVAARGRVAGQVVGDHHAWLLSLSIQDTTQDTT